MKNNNLNLCGSSNGGKMRGIDKYLKNTRRLKFWIILAFLLLLITATGIAAQSSGKYDLSWNVMSAGGGISENSNYEVVSSIGQVVVGNSDNVKYEVSSGFFAGGASPPVVIDDDYFIYLPSVLRP